MNAETAKRRATYEDVLAAPAHLVAEIINGVLRTHPRPVPRHATAAMRLGKQLAVPFDFDGDGPGGWVFMAEPELHLGSDIVVPDMAGWRRERLMALPDTPYLTLAPDWACEILSPSTERFDRGSKRQIYANAGVSFLWLVDVTNQIVEAFTLAGEHWLLAGTAVSGENVSLPPYEAAAFDIQTLFPFDEPKPAEDPFHPGTTVGVRPNQDSGD